MNSINQGSKPRRDQYKTGGGGGVPDIPRIVGKEFRFFLAPQGRQRIGSGSSLGVKERETSWGQGETMGGEERARNDGHLYSSVRGGPTTDSGSRTGGKGTRF